MNWNETEKTESVEHYLEHFSERIETDAEETYHFISKELETIYIRFDNDQEGRGVVGDTSISGNIAALEAVRAECVQRLKDQGKWPLPLNR